MPQWDLFVQPEGRVSFNIPLAATGHDGLMQAGQASRLDSLSLHSVYESGQNQAANTMNLTAAGGGVLIQDNAVPIAGSLFAVQSSAGVSYMAVTPSGVAARVYTANAVAGVQGVVQINDIADVRGLRLLGFNGGDSRIRWSTAAGVEDLQFKRSAANTLTLDNNAGGAAYFICLGDVTAAYFLCSSGTPSGSLGTANGAGGAPSISFDTGSNMHSGQITVVTGGAGAAVGAWFTITAPSSYAAPNGWSAAVFAADAATGDLLNQFNINMGMFVTSTVNGWTLNVTATTPAAGTTFKFKYTAFPY